MIWYDIILHGDYGFKAQLIPVILTVFISWSVSKLDVDMGFLLLPISLCMKMIFPFMDPAWIIIAAAMFLLNIIGTPFDTLSEPKSVPEKIKTLISKSSRHRDKEILKQAKAEIERRKFSADLSKKIDNLIHRR